MDKQPADMTESELALAIVRSEYPDRKIEPDSGGQGLWSILGEDDKYFTFVIYILAPSGSATRRM